MPGYDFTFLTQKFGNFWGFEWEIFQNFGLSEKIETFLSDILEIYGFLSLFSLIIFCTFSFMCENSKNCVMLHQFDNVRLVHDRNILN